MSGQMTTVGNGKTFLDLQSIQLPSVLARHEAPGLSGKYRQYSTMDVIQSMGGLGWLPVMAQEQRVNLPDKAGYQKHMVRFRNKDAALTGIRDLAAEIILLNSHDGKSSYQIMAGLIRFACLNGLIVSEAQFGAIRIRHLGYDPQEVIEATAEVTCRVPAIMGKVREYKSLSMTLNESRAFAESALILKYGDDDDKIERQHADGVECFAIGDRVFDTRRLLAPARTGDATDNLWGTYNIVQEKLTKGAKYERSEKTRDGSKKTRGITGICENVRVNRGLWHLMEEMAKMKTVRV